MDIDNNMIVISASLIILALLVSFFKIKKLQTAIRLIAFYLPFNSVRIFFLRLGGVSIGKNTKIGRFVKIGKNVSIGAGCRIENFVNLGNSITLSREILVEEYGYISMAIIGQRTVIHRNCVIWGNDGKNVKIGENSSIGHNTILDGTGGLDIGSHVHISSSSTCIWTHSSVTNAINGINISDENYMENLSISSVKIGNNIWIGGKVTIYPGTKVGDFSIILPNSVVSSDVQSQKMVGGIPAKLIKDTTHFKL